MSYVDQNRAGMSPDKTAWELVSGGNNVITVGHVEMPSRAYIAAFGFKGAARQKPVRLFSGGERNRLNLALTLKQGGNVLLPDEPTNDLDTEALASLEDALLDFPGCVVVTARDRWFLDRVVTHILAWEGSADQPAQWFWFEETSPATKRTRPTAWVSMQPARCPARTASSPVTDAAHRTCRARWSSVIAAGSGSVGASAKVCQ